MLKIVNKAVTLLCICHTAFGDRPIALHQLVQVDVAGDALIRLSGYDYDGDKVSSSLWAHAFANNRILFLSSADLQNIRSSQVREALPAIPSVQ